jgi:hypothetical protein
MTQPSSDQGQKTNGHGQRDSLADELQREIERLRQLAAEVKVREEADAEMRANYPHFKKIIYGWLRDKAERDLPPLPDDADLETIAREEGGLPLEAFIDELERKLQGP